VADRWLIKVLTLERIELFRFSRGWCGSEASIGVRRPVFMPNTGCDRQDGRFHAGRRVALHRETHAKCAGCDAAVAGCH
jgi:hypothetical protein